MQFFKSIPSTVLALMLGLCARVGLAADGAPTITTPPLSQTVYVGDPATFTVIADGTSPLAYRWFRNANLIASATGSSYTLATTTLNDQGALFSVMVSNALGTVTSDSAVLTIDQGAIVTQTNVLVNISSTTWRYSAGSSEPTGWKVPTYNDSSWSSGTALFGTETTPAEYSEPFRTSIPSPANGGPITTYYRTHFTLPTNTISVTLISSNLVDDGIVYWLNGQYAGNLRVATIPPSFSTTAANQPNEGTYEVLDLDSGAAVPGDNVLAAELHQQASTSSDAVFGMSLHAVVTTRTRDIFPPVVAQTIPAANSTARNLDRIEVQFDEGVSGVDASDLLINDVPATDIQIFSADQYVFLFPQPATGAVQVAWSPTHGIRVLPPITTCFRAEASRCISTRTPSSVTFASTNSWPPMCKESAMKMEMLRTGLSFSIPARARSTWAAGI